MKTLDNYLFDIIKSLILKKLHSFPHLYYVSKLTKFMSEDEQLEQLINQTLDGAMASIPAHLLEIEQNKQILKVDNPKEFVFGLVMGMALGLASAMLSAMKKGLPSPQDQLKIRDMVYKKVPQIRERLFE